MGEVDRLLQEGGHGADAQIALLIHDREAAGDRLRAAIGDQLLHAFDRHGAVDHHRLARDQRRDRAALIDVEPEGLRELGIEPLALDQANHPALSFEHREARDRRMRGAQVEHRPAGPALFDGWRSAGEVARQHLIAREAERMRTAPQRDG
jgi:hypothetical protein